MSKLPQSGTATPPAKDDRLLLIRGHHATDPMKSLQRTQVLLVGAMLFFAAMYFYQEPGWNGNTRLALVRAIVERGSLQIDAYWKTPGWITEDAAFFNGHYYSDKGPGSAL